MPKIKNSSVQWREKGKKKPFAYCEKASADLIIILANEDKNRTVKDVYNLIKYDTDAKNILQKIIDLGYGEEFAYKCC